MGFNYIGIYGNSFDGHVPSQDCVNLHLLRQVEAAILQPFVVGLLEARIHFDVRPNLEVHGSLVVTFEHICS